MSDWLKVYRAGSKEFDDCVWVWVSRARLSDASPLPPTYAELMAKEMAERKAWCACLSERRQRL